MVSQDVMIILVMTFPMFLFTIYPAIRVADFLEERYEISEAKKRTAMVSVTFLCAVCLSSLLHFL
ncbi:MAG: hypothetical protein WC667_09165 [Sulfurimonas sp.]|jgi:hypothetical protein